MIRIVHIKEQLLTIHLHHSFKLKGRPLLENKNLLDTINLKNPTHKDF